MKRFIAKFAKVPANVCSKNGFLGAGVKFLRLTINNGNNSIVIVQDKYCDVEVHWESI